MRFLEAYRGEADWKRLIDDAFEEEAVKAFLNLD